MASRKTKTKKTKKPQADEVEDGEMFEDTLPPAEQDPDEDKFNFGDEAPPSPLPAVGSKRRADSRSPSPPPRAPVAKKSRKELAAEKYNEFQLCPLTKPAILMSLYGSKQKDHAKAIQKATTDAKIVIRDSATIKKLRELDDPENGWDDATIATKEHVSLFVNSVEIGGRTYPVIRAKITHKNPEADLKTEDPRVTSVFELPERSLLVFKATPAPWRHQMRYGVSVFCNKINHLGVHPDPVELIQPTQPARSSETAESVVWE